MWKKIKEKWKERKGFGTIEIVISSFIVIMMIAGLVDLLSIIEKFETASQATSYVSRIVQKQGGVQKSRIDNYHGKYTTSKTLYNNVKDMMEANGIEDEDWTLKLKVASNNKVYTIKENTDVPLNTYGNRIKVMLTVKYRWACVSAFFPGEISGARTSTKEVLSGYKIRDNKELQTDLSIE